jgi:hypothetical protein
MSGVKNDLSRTTPPLFELNNLSQKSPFFVYDKSSGSSIILLIISISNFSLSLYTCASSHVCFSEQKVKSFYPFSHFIVMHFCSPTHSPSALTFRILKVTSISDLINFISINTIFGPYISPLIVFVRTS